MSCRTLQGKYAKKLQQRIDKVIDYINKNKIYAELEDYMKNGDYYIKIDELLEILEGKDDRE